MQVFLSGFGFLLLLATFFTLPETSHPGARGVDKMIEAEGRSTWVWLNPFSSLKLLKSPNITLLVRHQVLRLANTVNAKLLDIGTVRCLCVNHRLWYHFFPISHKLRTDTLDYL